MSEVMMILEDSEREIIDAFVIGLNLNEVAAVLGVSRQTVSKHLRKARRRNGYMSNEQLMYEWGRERE